MPADKVRKRRPRSDKVSREILLAAATEEFLRHGYDDTHITAILRRSGGSIRSIYEYFGDKRGLFMAALEHHSRSNTDKYISIVPPDADPVTYLRRFGRAYLDAILTESSMGFFRLVVASARDMPELCWIVMRTAQHVVVAQVASYLDRQVASGVMAAGNNRARAEMFISLIRDKFLIRAAFDPARKTANDEIDDFVKGAVDLFLAGVLSEAARDDAILTRQEKGVAITAPALPQ